ncbi:PhzF family phenazine biosynthesis protein [Erythrobacter colymbi]|uniref:PhzF family phenazine biosynthesis protein n=1 Tax=Erythrobacter colymbi TaxID=1161202 RepID=UPI001981C098|nr:PhzF family phenazine biosynthesis isomerase [Erythrobacter colymbi]
MIIKPHAIEASVQRLAAFSVEGHGGNPAGVVICDELPASEAMQQVAAKVGFSETVFAAPSEDGYSVRYFAPNAEISFCGHATIALGAALAKAGVTKPVDLKLNDGSAVVQGSADMDGLRATLWSAPTRHEPTQPELLDRALRLFGIESTDLDDRYPPAIIEAGARHLLLCLQDRSQLAKMNYDMELGAVLMREWHLATVSLVQQETDRRFHSRNAFAAGGVYEDPATGAAAAALVAYLAECGHPTSEIEVHQGYDMGTPCVLYARAPARVGGRAEVCGAVRTME